MAKHQAWRAVILGVVLAGLAAAAGAASPPDSRAASAAQTSRAQVSDADGRLAAARARHAELQKQVSDLEQQNVARRRRLERRDRQIATLRQQLDGPGKPAPAASTPG